MDYAPLTLDALEAVRPFFEMADWRTCDFTVGGMFMWRDYYHMEYTIRDDVFFSRLYDKGDVYYNIPLSRDLSSALRALIDEEGLPIRFCTVPKALLPAFGLPGASVSAEEQRVLFDYLYSADDLIRLSGKKYSGQRNQISQFKRNVDSWSFRLLDEASIDKVRAFFLEDYLPTASDGAFEAEENRRVLEVLDRYDTFRLTGGYLTADGEVVGFSVHEILGDTMFTHIEKASRKWKGAHQMLVNQSAVALAGSSVSYINREEDMGDPGLSMSKRSYHPIRLLEKYVVEVK